MAKVNQICSKSKFCAEDDDSLAGASGAGKIATMSAIYFWPLFYVKRLLNFIIRVIMLRFKYYWILFIGVIGFGGVGCNQIPDYPDAPRISFNDYKLLPKAGSTTLDSLLITINYTDGDGDLGLRNEETGPPYNEYAPEDTDQSNPLLTHYNWWMKMKGKKDGVFVDAYIPQPLAFYQRFPLLRDQSTKSVIDGIINYDVLITYIPNQRRPASHPIDQADPLDPSKVLYLDDTIAFEIRILDRALNQSNVILTSPIIVGQRKD